MNIIQSIWNYKCPRCRKGDIYVKPLKYTDPLDMHDRCDHCNLKFEPEPGYFFGAMFIDCYCFSTIFEVFNHISFDFAYKI